MRVVAKPTDVIGERVGAFVIDLVLWAGLWAAVLVAGEALGGGGAITLVWLTYALAGVAYWSVLPGLTGWTLGKRVLGLRVVRTDGTCPAGVGRNFLRQLGWIADAFPYFPPYLTGFVLVVATERRQRVGDLIADTLVVRAESAGQPLAGAFGGAAPGRYLGAGAQPAAGPVTAPPGAQPGAAPVAAVAVTPPDWYPDPRGEARLRYWDGSAWTDRTAD